MCGIAGFFSANQLQAGVLQRMTDAIRHRGPDDEGYCLGGVRYAGNSTIPQLAAELPHIQSAGGGRVGLGFRRLSIVDLSPAGHQPMISAQTDNVIVFNGEIYNYLLLRRKLVDQGIVFQSTSDTEVLLKGFDVWGEDVFPMLDGMFAVAIYQPGENKLTFARDRIGLKPLFYCQNEEGFFWCSEIKGLLASGKISRQVNWDGVFQNFMWQTTPGPQTCFEGIYALPPASVATLTGKDFCLQIKPFHRLPHAGDLMVDQQTAEGHVEKLLLENVKNQLAVDVPAALMMSGGIDSTLLAAFATQTGHPIPAFTLAYPGGKAEADNAALVARQYSLPHEVHPVTYAGIQKSILEDIRHFEEPYTTLEVLTRASNFAQNNGTKIIISGNGADELFGGYPHRMRYAQWSLLQKFRFLDAFLPASELSISKKLKKVWQLPTFEDFYRHGQGAMHRAEFFDLTQKLPLKPMMDLPADGSPDEWYFLLDMRQSLGTHHVYRDDLSAMKYGQEFRYPYLSNELIDYVAALPLEVRYGRKETKPLLRSIAAKHLPEQVLQMKKKGFTFPLGVWFRQEQALQTFVRDTLATLAQRHFLQQKTILHWLQQAHAGDAHALTLVWQLVTFEIWYETYIESSGN